VNLALHPAICLIGFDGTGIVAEVIQQSWRPCGSYELRSIRQQAGILVIAVAP
jgi:hypothetical protein